MRVHSRQLPDDRSYGGRPRGGRLARAFIALLGIGMLAVGGGCNRPFHMQVESITPAESTTTGTRYDARILIENRTDEALELKRFMYTASTIAGPASGEAGGETSIGIDGEPFFETVRAAGRFVEAGEIARLTLPIVWPAGVGPGSPTPETMVLTGTLSYRKPGAFARALDDAGLLSPETSFELKVGSPE